MTRMYLSYVAAQPHIVISHAQFMGGSLILRAPEFVRSPNMQARIFPGHVAWTMAQPGGELRYWWDAPPEVKQRWGSDFNGNGRAGEAGVDFELTTTNVAAAVHREGAYLLCLQAGALHAFQDYKGVRSFIRVDDRWVTVAERVGGWFQSHRMCRFPAEGGDDHPNVMAKVSCDGEWVLGLAIDRYGWRSCNHQQWPSCIHANPIWPELAPGECATTRGRVYLFQGTLEALYARYQTDFSRDTADSY